MSDPVIKKEESPETSVMDVPVSIAVVCSASTLVASGGATDELEDVKPTMPEPNAVLQQESVDPLAVLYHGSSLGTYKPAELQNSSAQISAPTLPVLACLPSGVTPTIATVRINKPISHAPITTSIASTLNHLKQHPKYKNQHATQQNSGMDGHEFDERNANSHEMQFPVLPQMNSANGAQDRIDDTVTIPRDELKNLRDHLQLLQNATAANDQHVAEQRMVIGELVTFNHNVHAIVTQLDNRMAKAEYENTFLRTMLVNSSDNPTHAPRSAPAVRPPAWYRGDIDARSRSPSPIRHGHRDREDGDVGGNSNTVAGIGKKKMTRKQLQIKIPGKMFAPGLAAGLPTPMTKTAITLPTSTFMLSSRTPKTPITPGRMGPANVTKKSTTSIHKRGNHNLDKLMPPPNVQIPLVPLTDTEVIVYFYQSLSRPMVALRLYARNWGPRDIVNTLNDHRETGPPYLRNTCSVKCTTAIKNGRKRFGEEWEAVHRQVFENSNDLKATDLIQLTGDELTNAVDYEVRSLCIGLRKHPKEDVDGGIFTRCVKYCQEHDAPYTMSNVWQLAMDLQAERTPHCPPPLPISGLVGYFDQHQRQQQKRNDTESDGGESETPEPIVGSKPTTGQRRRANSAASALPGFTTLDPVVREHNEDAIQKST